MEKGCTEWITSILENVAVINGISLIISVVMPILVMICTLRSQNKRAKIEQKFKEKEFQETMQKNEKYHQESMQLQEESVRVSQRPFLFLNQDFEIGNRKGRHTFPLEITNLGNGTAFQIAVKWESGEIGNCINGLPIVCMERMVERIKIYRYTGYLFTNVLPVGSKASFELLLQVYDDGNEISQDNLTSGKVQFSIKYEDSYCNEYEQDYMFIFSVATGIGRVESYLPRLVKKNITRSFS